MEADNKIRQYFNDTERLTPSDQHILFALPLETILNNSLSYKQNWLALCTDCLAQPTLLLDDDTNTTSTLPSSSNTSAFFHPTSQRIRIESNLAPTYGFYIGALGDEKTAILFIKGFPTFLGYSLEKRLEPRLAEAKDVGMVIDATCLRFMTTFTKVRWNASIVKYKAIDA